jgi:hypothetical protein
MAMRPGAAFMLALMGLVPLSQGCGQRVAPPAPSAPGPEAVDPAAWPKSNPTGAPQAPVVAVQTMPASVATTTPAGSLAAAGAVRSRVTFAKDGLESREYLYGADVQHSGKPGGDPTSVFQALAVGHEIARFRIAGDVLQLVADTSYRFESDINHPERLLSEWPIVDQTEGTLTVDITRGSPALVTVANGDAALPERASWVRSLVYVPETRLLAFETSLEASDGVVWEFMESLFPRDALVKPKATPFLLDPSEAVVSRYRFLDASTVFSTQEDGSRASVAVASRWDLAPGRVIEWYVTRNAPDMVLPDLQAGVEGWNRYFRAMWKRDAIAFKGRLPEGVAIGDPRYNVLVWDAMVDVDAAYESQASDPLTGVQSHALIYVPRMWWEAGLEFWRDGQYTEARERGAGAVARAVRARSFLGRALGLPCARGATSVAPPPETATGEASVEAFAHTLVRGTVFHEVGHSFGFDHNFEASLSFDPSKPATYSTSIMDYNQYDLDRASFTTGSNGPLLEYDRQFLSVLYDGGREVKPTDPVLPACNDAAPSSRTRRCTSALARASPSRSRRPPPC